MVFILLFMSELLADDDAFLSDQIFQTVTLFGNSGGDGPSLVLVLALRVHVVRFAVLVLASPFSRAGGCRGYPLEADEQGLQAGNTADSDGDEVFDDGPNHEVGEAPDVVNSGKEAIEVEGADNSSGTSTAGALSVVVPGTVLHNDTYRKPRLRIAARPNLSFLSIWRFQRITKGRMEHEKSVIPGMMVRSA